MVADELYLGAWKLDPELCVHQDGEPPLAGLYVIERRPEGLHFSIDWTGRDGIEHRVNFGGACDGSRVPLGEGARHMTIDRIDTRTLDSSVFDGDTKLAWARRTASEAGDLLAVVQESYGTNGAPPRRNFQVYRRERQALDSM